MATPVTAHISLAPPASPPGPVPPLAREGSRRHAGSPEISGSELRLLVADAHAVVRKGVIMILLGAFPEMHFGEACCACDLITLVQQHGWTLVLTGICFADSVGLEPIKKCKAARPATPILVHSSHPEEHYAMRALRAGAAGYVQQSIDAQDLVLAARTVMDGQRYLSPRMIQLLGHQVSTFGAAQSPLSHLTDRELEVLTLITQGLAVSQIGDRLHRSVKTISSHRAHLLQKLSLKRTADLIRYGIAHGLAI